MPRVVKLNVHQAKTHLSRYLRRLEKGETTIILCRRNVPIAEIRALPKEEKKGLRPIGLAKGQFVIPASFFEPLPEEILRLWEGRGGEGPEEAAK